MTRISNLSRRYFSATLDPGLSEPGVSTALQIFTDQVTLSQPGGQIMPTTVLRAPPDFQTLRRPWHKLLNWDLEIIFFTFVVLRPPVLTKVWPKTLSYRNIPFRLYCPALRKSCVQFSFSGNILEATGTKWWFGQVPYIHDFLIMQSIYFVFGCGILILSVQYIVFHLYIELSD